LEREPAGNERSPGKRTGPWLYRGLLVVIVVGSLAVYLGWWTHFRSYRPEFSTAEPLTIRETVSSRTILLWGETVLVSPVDGVVHFPLGPGTVRVSKGDIVVEILSGSQKAIIKVPQSGYFVPGLDGLEGKWSFSGAWPGDGELPPAGSLKWKAEGERVSRGRSVGKLIPQPQELRAIAYVEMDEATRGQIRKGTVLFSIDGERPQQAFIRAVQDYGSKAKVYVTLPFFPMTMANSRSRQIEFFQGELKGVVVPESALLQKAGGVGVYAFCSGKLEYRNVTGKPLADSRFLVTGGLKAGDLVLSQAAVGAERKVLLW
jgi:hypothetical protein